MKENVTLKLVTHFEGIPELEKTEFPIFDRNWVPIGIASGIASGKVPKWVSSGRVLYN